MAISTYSELKTALANYSGRSGLTSMLADFITLAEHRIKNGSTVDNVSVKPLRTRFMLDSSNLVTVAETETVALPTGFLEINGGLYISGDNGKPLENVTYSKTRGVYSSQVGEPRYYSILGSNLILEPIPDGVYTIPMSFYKLSALSDSNTTNNVLTYHSDVYLHASLVELYIYTGATDRLVKAFQAYASAVASAIESSQASIYTKNTRVRSKNFV